MNGLNGLKTEAGAVDNRLTLNPADFPVINSWKDGQYYDITIGGVKTRMSQMSPGEFEVEPPRETGVDDSEPEPEVMASTPAESPVESFANDRYGS